MSRDLGDFQTPPALVEAILESLTSTGRTWSRVLEPTCGRGNFIRGLATLVRPPDEIYGIEIQDRHFNAAQQISRHIGSTTVAIRQGNLFDINLRTDLKWRSNGSLLVIGNPPWITNAELGVMASSNLPRKENLKGLSGLEALTGSANFDIAEYIWLKLIHELAVEHPTIALLCKTSVARNVLQFAAKANLPVAQASIRKIDAQRWFGAAVDACLFQVEIGSSESHYQYEAAVYRNLIDAEPETTLGIRNGLLIANAEIYKDRSALEGASTLIWRQGLKHDAASVMELTFDVSGNLRNKLGEMVSVEADYVYPLLKSSDLFHGKTSQPDKAVIVTQKQLGEDTRHLRQSAPKLWNYLTAHAKVFERRKSSIYVGKPPFSIFGIGSYSFAHYKVGISGLHKAPKFRAIGPINGRPVMLDDTCYFVACQSAQQAALLISLLNQPICSDFLSSTVFVDAKRPITKKILQRIDLQALLNSVERESLLTCASVELKRLGMTSQRHDAVWPLSLDEFLVESSPTLSAKKQLNLF